MRKIGVICIAIIFTASNVFAQELKEKVKKAEKDFSEILPHAEDFALGLDMARFTQSLLSGITQGTNYSPTWAFESDFYGKYFLTNNSALRARLGIKMDNRTDKRFVRDDVANLLKPEWDNPITMEKTVDVYNSRNTRVELGIGYEFRRSLWRVQGYVGGEIFGGITVGRDFFDYGNPMTETNQTPTTTGWSTNPYNTGSYRLLDTKSFGFTAGAAAIVGADFFICRNLSIGAEFKLEGRYTRWGEVTGKTETWMYDQAYTAEEKLLPAGSSGSMITPTGYRNTPTGFTLNPGWGLNLMIYF